MPNDIRHERMRWSYMDHRQLATRLGRITDRQKLRNFIQVADEEGDFELCDMARAKLLEVHGEASTHVRRDPVAVETRRQIASHEAALGVDDQRTATPREEQAARRRLGDAEMVEEPPSEVVAEKPKKPVRKIRKKPEKAKVRVVRFHRR